jgi:hypothetical protein
VLPQELEEMVRTQHRELVEAIRSGLWLPDKPSTGYTVVMLNPNKVAQGDYLRFELCVKDRSENSPVAGVSLDVRWLLDGTVVERQALASGAGGFAEMSFPTPIDRKYATLLVCAQGPEGRELAKFHVRGSSPV